MAEVAGLHHASNIGDEKDDEASLRSRPCPLPPAAEHDLVPSGEQIPHLDGHQRRPVDSNIFLPMFTPYHQSPVLNDRQTSLDSDSESSYFDDQINLVLDLSDGCSPPPESDGASQMGFSCNSVDSFNFGIFDEVEDMGSDYLELGPELGLGFGLEKLEHGEGVGTDSEDDEGLDLDVDGFIVGGGEITSAPGAAEGEPSRLPLGEGLRVVGFESESDSDEEVEIACRMGTNSEGLDAPDLNPSVYLDSLRIEEDRWNANEDFDWEEVEIRVNEREVVSTAIADDDSSISSDENSDFEVQDGEEGAHSALDWQVLLTMNNWGWNAAVEPEDTESYEGREDNDYSVHTSGYEVLFDQLVDQENFMKRGLPAAKSAIERLPSVVLTELDVANNNTICAVCKDDILLEDKAKKMPCSHYYHTNCILPWLKIRNTCPVCRHELPTDDPQYENWRSWRTASGVAVTDPQVRYLYAVGILTGE